MNRTITIGDIHGGLRALKELLLLVNPTPTDTLIFLGDYVDGWSESAQTVQFILELRVTIPCIFIKGNHDVWCEQWLRSGASEAKWLIHGGQETVDSYAGISAEEKQAHLSFFESMPYYYIDDKNRLFIHAGFTSMHGPQAEFHLSNFSWDRTLWEMAITMDKRIKKDDPLYPKRLLLFHEIYIGHTPTLYYDVTTPMQGCNVWNVDTGAAFTGHLSAVDVDTKFYWQTEPVWKLYPGEEGRNKNRF
jgi:serine/threonine protein phosphatase 1